MQLETDIRVVVTMSFLEHPCRPVFLLTFDSMTDKDMFFATAKALAGVVSTGCPMTPGKVRAIRHLRNFSEHLLVSVERIDVKQVYTAPYKLPLLAAKLLIEEYM